jgi:hypothetical protein
MQLKPITTIIVLFLLVASLLVAGCIQTEVTLSPANQASNVSTAYPTAGKSELLQAIVARNSDNANMTFTWINDTAVKEHYTYSAFGGAFQYTKDITFIHFPTVNAASAFFDSKRPQYSEKSLSADYGSTYYLASHQDAKVIKSVWDLKTISRYDDVTYRLEQLDALIVEAATQSHTVNQA